MSRIRKYRINCGDITDSTEFYFKFERKNRKLLCNLCLSDEGLFYYRPKSQILSPKENLNARNSYDGYVSAEDLFELFEALRKAGLNDDSKLNISRVGRKVTIEAQRRR